MRGLKSSDSKSSSENSTGATMGMSQPNTSSPFAAASQSSATAPKVNTIPASSASAVIGPKIRVKGELVGEEDLLIQGQVDGLVDLKNHTLTIGEQGIVKADVLAKTITIEGTVEGDLFGQERISILSSSNVKGNLVAERVILEDGAKFRGSIDMDVESHKDKFQKFTGYASSSPSAPAAKPSEPKMKEPTAG